MKNLLLVGLGGFLGAVSRYQLSGLILHRSENWKFPLATFIVNILGCAVAGILAGLVEKHDFFTASTRLFLFTGILGGFTTFSAFGVETVSLLQRQEYAIAATYAALSIIAGLSVLWICLSIT